VDYAVPDPLDSQDRPYGLVDGLRPGETVTSGPLSRPRSRMWEHSRSRAAVPQASTIAWAVATAPGWASQATHACNGSSLVEGSTSVLVGEEHGGDRSVGLGESASYFI
jgi:hypothetical protein